VYLKESPLRGLRHFTVRGKITTRFIGPFQIMEKRGEVAYQLELPSQLLHVHNVLHVSQLKKCMCVQRANLKDRRRRPEERVNGSQSKFLEKTWPISRNRPFAHLF
jgi:hypothetical protein